MRNGEKFRKNKLQIFYVYYVLILIVLFMKDLFMLDEGNSNFIGPDHLINFEKFKMLGIYNIIITKLHSEFRRLSIHFKAN
jgi:hypothetical protein